MARGIRSDRRKDKINVTIEREIHEWALGQSGPGKKFSSLSHAVEFALYRLREALEEE